VKRAESREKCTRNKYLDRLEETLLDCFERRFTVEESKRDQFALARLSHRGIRPQIIPHRLVAILDQSPMYDLFRFG